MLERPAHVALSCYQIEAVSMKDPLKGEKTCFSLKGIAFPKRFP